MPRFTLNLDEINGLRVNLATQDALQTRLDMQISEQRAAISTMQRQGVSGETLEAGRDHLISLQNERQHVSEERTSLRHRVNLRADEFARERDPALLAQALDGGQPIALLPVRLETRYTPNRDTLRIRVYPDVLHVVQHNQALTDKERKAGMEYWHARFRNDAADAERLARDMSVAYGRSQTQRIIRVLTPENLALQGHDGVAPTFPDIPAMDAKAKATRALLLPDRWCAIGYALGRREVFRVWGKRIPDELPMSPDWLNLKEKQEPLFGGDRRWMVDFDAALENGMALQITQAEIDRGFLGIGQAFQLNDTLERLIVLGLEWTKDATQTAKELADLFSAQRDSRGLGFVPLGTPTNNTEAASSGHSLADERAPPPTPAELSALPKQKDALELLNAAFGLPAGRLDADDIAHAHLAEQRTAMHMMNALWRGTFGDYLLKMWNPMPFLNMSSNLVVNTEDIYKLRRFAVSYLRPAGPFPVLRVGNQPYGVLPVVGKNFTGMGDDSDDQIVDSSVGKVLNVLRPMWEFAWSRENGVPLLTDGNVTKAQEILQTGPWSQRAFYRDLDQPDVFNNDNSFFGLRPIRDVVVQNMLGAFGINQYKTTWVMHQRFFADPPYSARELIGVPWILSDEKDLSKEAPDSATFPAGQNYLKEMADRPRDDTLLNKHQKGPALLQALVAYSVAREGEEAESVLAAQANGVTQIRSSESLLHVELRNENEARFEVRSPQELRNVVISSVTGRSTIGQFLEHAVITQQLDSPDGPANLTGKRLFAAIEKYPFLTREIGAVRFSLNYLSTRTVGELNCAFRTTLDAFSYRLDAWYTARASRRLEKLRERKPVGLYVGGFGWVENLKPDNRPDSEGYMLAPSIGQAATAAVLRSGFVANHEHGAFDINLTSQRTRRALDILQGLTRDQPLAALYGYRIERGLRDKALGKLILPLRLAFPWRAAANNAAVEPKESVGARDVVDGVALFEAWQSDPGAASKRLNSITVNGHQPFNALLGNEQADFERVVAEGLDLADAVSDLLMAEGVHQIVQGNFERAGAAMAVADKQSLPIETQVARTPRGGIMYTQRVAVLCPIDVAGNWPQDRKARAEPRLNAWLAHMLGAPEHYQFSATVHRGDVIDQDPITVGAAELGYSPLSAVLAATAITITQKPNAEGVETGFRGCLVKALIAKILEPDGVTGLEIKQDSDNEGSLGLGHFEAIATTLRGQLDKNRPLTRKDLVVSDDEIEKNALVNEGEFPGVDLAQLQSRAIALIGDFEARKDALAASVATDDLWSNLTALEDFLPAASWPPEVLAIDAVGAEPDGRETRGAMAKAALATILQAKLDQANTSLTPPPASPPSHGQLVQQAMDQIKMLLGRDFPVLPEFGLGDYAAEFNASLAEQDALTLGKSWQVTGWMTQLARVREGLDGFVGALSAHDALVDISPPTDFSVVQYPHRSGQVWAALPEAWKEPDGTAPDIREVPEELKEFVANSPTAYKHPQRNKPKLVLALHTPGGLAQFPLAGFVCDEWQEAIPDPFQTAGIGFHYDAPGARPPQNILLAVPPQLNQEHWRFDDVLDVVHEAWDLARMRAVRPKDLGSDLGTLLPGNFLQHGYTEELASVKFRQMAKQAVDAKYKGSVVTLATGKV